jgi:hypothetical protein
MYAIRFKFMGYRPQKMRMDVIIHVSCECAVHVVTQHASRSINTPNVELLARRTKTHPSYH